MKNIIQFISVFFITIITVQAQISLTSSTNPVPGDISRYINVDTTGISQGNSGSNQTWNFTNLTILDSSDTYYVSANGTPYASSFSSSNLASTYDNGSTYAYYTTSSSSWTFNGIGSQVFIMAYSNPATYLTYPFNYGSNQSDNFAATYVSNNITWYRTGTINVTGDAWGTINLPFGSFSNSLRIKFIQTIKDSANIGGFPVVVNTTETSYYWFAPNKKFEVFSIRQVEGGKMNQSQFSGGSGSKWVAFNRNQPIGIKPINGNVPVIYGLSQNYPNPFNPNTSINIDIPKSSFLKLTIYDVLGREVAVLVNQNLNIGSYLVTWDASDISSGIYFYTLEADGFRETKRMNLVK